MIFSDFFKSLTQFSDRRFRRVVWLGIALALLLLFAVYAGFLMLLASVTDGSISLPIIGEISYVHELLGLISIVFMLVLSVFLMVPVASVFTGLYLDDVADAVESHHYPWLDPKPRRGFVQGLVQSLRFIGVLVGVNVLALIAWGLLPFGIPFFWVAVNGYLLSREYFFMVAERRIEAAHARELARYHRMEIWLAGCLMTLPLMIPIVNLLVPVLGVATFTHLYHRLPDPRGKTAA